jgi:hypothetical protein
MGVQDRGREILPFAENCPKSGTGVPAVLALPPPLGVLACGGDSLVFRVIARRYCSG